MQRNRKIFYDYSGEVIDIVDGDEVFGDVHETTIAEAFQTRPLLQGKDTSTINVIELDYSYRKAEFENMGSCSVNPQTEELTIYPLLTIQADKTQIQSDGIDTTTITSDHAEYYSINGEGQYYPNVDDDFLFSSEVPGTYTITAHSTLYDSNSLVIEVI